ncbi:hypothetical protein [Candidatus Hecatella orcuttiae]|uniref:hypothetical protein n=1 Tax=Candidatus Hecatella orcuttiae TaxID=1935119 RepID=UPI0028683575|nr:hypothetical protein [Candidatus Hecatella orcuttiae]
MGGKTRVNLTLDSLLVKAIDQVRGPISRSSFIQALIEEALKSVPRERRRGLAKGEERSKLLRGVAAQA